MKEEGEDKNKKMIKITGVRTYDMRNSRTFKLYKSTEKWVTITPAVPGSRESRVGDKMSVLRDKVPRSEKSRGKIRT